MTFHTQFGAPLAAEPTTIDGQAVYRVPLSGGGAEGSFALVDPEGLERLREAGARFLYVVEDGNGNSYVVFLRTPSKSTFMASRVILNAPSGRRVAYRNGNRLDLRFSNLVLQLRKGEERQARDGEKSQEVNQGWQAHQRQRRLEEREWKQAPKLPKGSV